MNKASDTQEFTLDIAINNLKSKKCDIFAIIPSEDAVLSSVNKGYPLVLENINNDFSQAIFNIAETINPAIIPVVPEEKTKKKSFLSNLFAKKEKSPKKENDKKKSLIKKKEDKNI